MFINVNSVFKIQNGNTNRGLLLYLTKYVQLTEKYITGLQNNNLNFKNFMLVFIPLSLKIPWRYYYWHDFSDIDLLSATIKNLQL